MAVQVLGEGLSGDLRLRTSLGPSDLGQVVLDRLGHPERHLWADPARERRPAGAGSGLEVLLVCLGIGFGVPVPAGQDDCLGVEGPTVVFLATSVPPSWCLGHHVHDQSQVGIQRVVTWFHDHDDHVQLTAGRVLAVPLQGRVSSRRARRGRRVVIDHVDHVGAADPMPTGSLREPQLHWSIMTDRI